MKTILVPTDFSRTAENAGIYAATLAKQTGTEHIILFHAYASSTIVTGDPMVPALNVFNINELKEAAEENLKRAAEELRQNLPAEIAIETLSEYGFLPDCLHSLCTSRSIDLVVMGISGEGSFQENFIGSNAINVAKHIHTPVIIVPNQAKAHSIKKIAVASDFKEVAENTPFNVIRKILEETSAELFVLNVDHNDRNRTESFEYEHMMLETFFEKYQPSVHLIDSPDFVGGINQFVEENNIDLVVMIPKKHGLFESVFKRSHTKMLAFHAKVPLMVVHK